MPVVLVPRHRQMTPQNLGITGDAPEAEEIRSVLGVGKTVMRARHGHRDERTAHLRVVEHITGARVYRWCTGVGRDIWLVPSV